MDALLQEVVGEGDEELKEEEEEEEEDEEDQDPNAKLPMPENWIEPRLFLIKNDNTGYEFLNEK